MSPIAARALTMALALGGAVGAVAIPRALVEAAPSHSITISAPEQGRSSRIRVSDFLLPASTVVRKAPVSVAVPAAVRPRVQPTPLLAQPVTAGTTAVRPHTASPRPAPQARLPKANPHPAPAPAPAPAPPTAPEPEPDPTSISEPVEARTAPQPAVEQPAAPEPAKRGKGHDKPRPEKREPQQPDKGAPAPEPAAAPEESVEQASDEQVVVAPDDSAEEAGGNGHGNGKGHEQKNH